MKLSPSLPRLGSLLLLALLSGCMMGPNYERPEVTAPDSWHPDVEKKTEAEPIAIDEWWTVFDDSILADLMHQAATNNLDLKTAFSRIEEAAAARGIAKGDYWPQIDGSGSATANRLSDIAGGASAEDRTPNLYSIGLDASWELDFWGRIRRSVQSADASLQASVEDYRDTLIILYSEIANSYLSVRELQMRIALAKGNVKSQKDTLKLTQGRFDAGLVPEMDVHQSKLNLSRTESAVPAMRQDLAAAINRLAVLTGQTPDEIQEEVGHRDKVPHPDIQVLTGLPANLLRQRPDVRRAEQQLIAQNAQIGVAKADLLPRISLSGSFALEANESGDLSQSGSQSYQFGPTFRWALFQGGRIRSNIQAEEARTDQAVYQYQQAVLLALEDVENAYVSCREERDRLDFIQESVDAARKTVSQVNTLYENGLVTFLNVLDAERSLAEQEDSLAQSNGRLSRNIVSVYRSLGGGWDEPAEDAASVPEPDVDAEPKSEENTDSDSPADSASAS
jgi:outer membrane protein, multidrug efflux system